MWHDITLRWTNFGKSEKQSFCSSAKWGYASCVLTGFPKYGTWVVYSLHTFHFLLPGHPPPPNLAHTGAHAFSSSFLLSSLFPSFLFFPLFFSLLFSFSYFFFPPFLSPSLFFLSPFPSFCWLDLGMGRGDSSPTSDGSVQDIQCIIFGEFFLTKPCDRNTKIKKAINDMSLSLAVKNQKTSV